MRSAIRAAIPVIQDCVIGHLEDSIGSEVKGLLEDIEGAFKEQEKALDNMAKTLDDKSEKALKNMMVFQVTAWATMVAKYEVLKQKSTLMADLHKNLKAEIKKEFSQNMGKVAKGMIDESTERPPLAMAKKKHQSNKKQNRGKGAKQVRKEARKEAAQHLGGQDKPSKQVVIDEKGRKMTVIMGGEAEMDKLWERMQMTFALQFQSKTISEWLEGARAALHAQPNKDESGQENFKQLEWDIERLVGRMRDTINANNRQAAQQGLQTLDLVSADLPLVEGLRIEDFVTGLEADLVKATTTLNNYVSSLTQASGLEDPENLQVVPSDNDRMRLRGG
ncbi:hypothetical protein CSAL01_02799 [Colletotrichum salicis]|uniref:Uncharacterized protein n=1 Tax=Colletotrichum salicis TaxID=1209931 RepID=A0A135SZK6_9PEZI|nr:hypothetical protein CSAL01_02799 [Colletotrichum salicis]